jgi:hypothetical protein
MNDYTPSLQRLASLARTRPALLAGPLTLYKEQEGLSDEQLASLLQCDIDALPKLALCERPRKAPHFRVDVERIATYIHADVTQLARVIRAAEAREALHSRSGANMPSLLAARDQEGDEDNSNDE